MRRNVLVLCVFDEEYDGHVCGINTMQKAKTGRGLRERQKPALGAEENKVSQRKCRDGDKRNGQSQSVLITSTVQTCQLVLLDSGACRHWQPTEKMSRKAGDSHT